MRVSAQVYVDHPVQRYSPAILNPVCYKEGLLLLN